MPRTIVRTELREILLAWRSFEFALHERLVDDDLGGDIGEFTSLPRFDLLAHWLKVPLHLINIDRNTIDEPERLRVFRQHRRKCFQIKNPTKNLLDSSRIE